MWRCTIKYVNEIYMIKCARAFSDFTRRPGRPAPAARRARFRARAGARAAEHERESPEMVFGKKMLPHETRDTNILNDKPPSGWAPR